MPTYSDRYLAGEHEPVWRELISHGAAVREEPLLSEARAVCREVVRRAVANLRTLHERLTALGYQFAHPATALVDAGPGAGALIRDTEAEFGTLPLIVHAWYGAVAAVDFSQADEQRVYGGPAYPSPMGSNLSGLGSHPVLVFQSLDRCRAMSDELQVEAELDPADAEDAATRSVVKSRRLLPLGGWASNCDPKGFPVPCFGVDGVIYNDGAGGICFVDELRTAFRWGGFPFWRPSLANPRFSSPGEYRPNFAKVLPILQDGLLEL